MAEGSFSYEEDLLKHHVRLQGWLPACKRRLQIIRSAYKQKKGGRRLKYFTFCAVGAVDVLMLDVARIIRPSSLGKFDTVVFFDRYPESVVETQKRIPGAIGFPGDFVQIVLLEDPDEDTIIDDTDHLKAPADKPDFEAVRRSQVQLQQRHDFMQEFPFDVINLDLEEFLFKPQDPMPGKVINALRKILSWQHRNLKGTNYQIDGFSLMFTTQIGPPNIGEDYIQMLIENVEKNVQQDESLVEALEARTGIRDLGRLRSEYFDQFFKLATPKLLASTLMEKDWYIDPEYGILVFEFERPSQTGPYNILHLVMDIKRHNPPERYRAPGAESIEARNAYRRVVQSLFAKNVVTISESELNIQELKASLAKIQLRRRKYYSGE